MGVVLSCPNLLGRASGSSIQAFASGSSRNHWAIRTLFNFDFTWDWIQYFYWKFLGKSKFLFYFMRIKQKQNDYILKIYVELKNSTADKPNSLKNKKNHSETPQTNSSQPETTKKLSGWAKILHSAQTWDFFPLPITTQPFLLISWVSCLKATHPAHKNQ